MPGLLHVYKFAQGGVNLAKSPLHLSDDEVTQAQNAEIVPDSGVGGDGSISKRGGLSVLSAALAGGIVGLFGLPLLTSYTRTLYTARGSQNSNTFSTTTNGTSFISTASPLALSIQSNWTDENGARDAHRMVAFKTFIIYPGNDYTKGSSNPTIDIWDSTTAQLMESVPVGPSGNGTFAYAITDMLTANSLVYLTVHDPGGTGTNLAGRVMVLDPITGQLFQVLNAFGNNTGEVTVGYPNSLAWYQGQLWTGLNNGATTDNIGKVVRCYPATDTIWTTDVSNLPANVSSLAVYNGDLYAGLQSSAANAPKVSRRSATTGAWVTSYTSASAAGDTGHIASLIVYGSNLYGVDYSTQGGNSIKIKKFDGTSWTTDRDVVATDGGSTQLPGSSVLFGADLFFVFRSTTAGGADGFIMRLSSGSWSKVDTANYDGPLAVLVARV